MLKIKLILNLLPNIVTRIIECLKKSNDKPMTTTKTLPYVPFITIDALYKIKEAKPITHQQCDPPPTRKSENSQSHCAITNVKKRAHGKSNKDSHITRSRKAKLNNT